MAFTFFNRKSGKGLRVVLKPDAFKPDNRHLELIQKMQNGTANDAEIAEFKRFHEKRTHAILEKPVEEIFDFKEAQFDLPDKARILPSVSCSHCGESTMESKLIDKNGRQLCKACDGAL